MGTRLQFAIAARTRARAEVRVREGAWAEVSAKVSLTASRVWTKTMHCPTVTTLSISASRVSLSLIPWHR